MNKQFLSSLSALLLVGALFIVGCGGNAQEQNDSEQALTGTIKVDGSSTVYPITEAVAEEFRAEAPKVKVTIGVSGTGGGFKKFSRGETDISDASRPIKESEAAACKENGIDYVELTVAYDGLAVVVNPQNDWATSLTTEELKKIWEPAAQDKIVNWNQIRPEFPDHKLTLLGPGTASGTFDYFTEAIVGESGASRGDYMPSEDDHVLVQGVAGDKYALGFFGLAYFEENQDKLKLVAVDNGNGPVLPSIETVKNGTYAPLSRPIFIYVNAQSVKRPEVVKFVEFYLTEAADLVKDVGYVPLQKEEYAQQLEKFRAFVAQHASM
ncbi:MAG: PstS family phosphate ABC transporter substrate-binding protein [Bacteroidetes bacterium]|nr:MAG: PstS family phosphate ABC transporter substrate-binding protein [Bacteroidota bacterium]